MNEAVHGGSAGSVLREAAVPVREEVRSICEMLGLDPYYLACEGRLAAVVDAASAEATVTALRRLPQAADAAIVGQVTDDYPGKVAVETPLGTRRLLQMLSGEQLPRIC